MTQSDVQFHALTTSSQQEDMPHGVTPPSTGERKTQPLHQRHGSDSDVEQNVPPVTAEIPAAPDIAVSSTPSIHDIETYLRIDELAHEVGLPSRTIRFYNTEGLLPAPLMRGRVAFYTQEHVQVLHIIRELKEQQHLPLETIKRLLDIRTQQGDLHMNLALKQRLHFATGEARNQRFLLTEFAQRCAVSIEHVQQLLAQDLLFPVDVDGVQLFSSDDVLLVELYQHLEELGLPLALPALIRFQLRQLVRSETAAYEQHLVPHWEKEGLTQDEQTAQFEQLLTLSDTLISLMHRRLLYQG